MDAAWHPDPGGRHELRYWDGSSWTDHVSDNGQTSLDPLPPYPGAPVETHSTDGQADHLQADHLQVDQGVVDLSSEPTRFAPGGSHPATAEELQGQAQAPTYEAWSRQGTEPAEVHEAQTLPPADDPAPYAGTEPIFASMGETETGTAAQPAQEPHVEPHAEPADELGAAAQPEAEPASEPAADPDAWVRDLLADGEQLRETVSGDERDVTVTSHRVLVRERSGDWSAARLDRVSHVEVSATGSGAAVEVFLAGGRSHRVVVDDTQQAVALVRALTT